MAPNTAHYFQPRFSEERNDFDVHSIENAMMAHKNELLYAFYAFPLPGGTLRRQAIDKVEGMIKDVAYLQLLAQDIQKLVDECKTIQAWDSLQPEKLSQ